MRARSATLASIFLLGLGTAVTVRAEPDPQQADLVAREYLEAIRARGFSAEADFLHPDELARFQGLLLPVLEFDEAQGRRTLLNATFGRDATLLDARLADPADFLSRFARVMAVRMPEQHVGFDSLEVLGAVEEAERRHVLVRLQTVTDAVTYDELAVISLMPDGDTWKVMLTPGLRKAALGLGPGGEERPAPRLVPHISAPPPARPGTEPVEPGS